MNKLTANEQRALAEFKKPPGKVDYNKVHGITLHALQRKKLIEGRAGNLPGWKLTATGHAALKVPNVFDELFVVKSAAKCPQCEHLFSVDRNGLLTRHLNWRGMRCLGSGADPATNLQPAKKPAAKRTEIREALPDAFRGIENVAVDLHDPVRDRWRDDAAQGGVRLYCTSTDASWALQVRAWVKTKYGKRGKHFAIGSASMSRADLQWLRDRIDAALREKS